MKFHSVTKLKKTNISHVLTLDFKNFLALTLVPFYSVHPVLSVSFLQFKQVHLWHVVNFDIKSGREEA
jgi:hypothetical protein